MTGAPSHRPVRSRSSSRPCGLLLLPCSPGERCTQGRIICRAGRKMSAFERLSWVSAGDVVQYNTVRGRLAGRSNVKLHMNLDFDAPFESPPCPLPMKYFCTSVFSLCRAEFANWWAVCHVHPQMSFVWPSQCLTNLSQSSRFSVSLENLGERLGLYYVG